MNRPGLSSDGLEPGDLLQLERMKSAARREEFTLSRRLLAMLDPAAVCHRSVSHCRSLVAAGVGFGHRLGIDVECRQPRNPAEVAAHFGWSDWQSPDAIQLWTLWEAWRKLERGSVLDPPDRVYAKAASRARDFRSEPVLLDGVIWFSIEIDGAWLSVAARL